MNWTLPERSDKRFGAAVKDALESRNMTQKELAEAIGKDESHVTRLISGEYKRPPKAELMEQVAVALRLSANYFREYRAWLNYQAALYGEAPLEREITNAREAYERQKRKVSS